MRRFNRKKRNKKNDAKASSSSIVPDAPQRNKRHRRIDNNEIKEEEEVSSNNTITTTTEDETLWQVFSNHPLIRVGMFLVIPYAFHSLRFMIQLQYPEYLSGLLQLRPAVGITDLRQVLIVGSQSTGTVQTTSTLQSLFELEIGHEVSDTAWNFVRDGTISWFHGIRFLPPSEEKIQSFKAICENPKKNMGFHPAGYGPSKCSYRIMNKNSDNCWKRDCYTILTKEWSCAHRNNNNNEITKGKLNNGCETNFVRTLHQVRNPLRTIESLAVKFCVDGLDNNTVSESFLSYAGALFPTQHNFTDDSCIEAVGYFLYYYQNTMIEARSNNNNIIHNFYRIEDSTPCQIAELAGFYTTTDNKVTALYGPNQERISKLCSNADFEGNRVMEQKENKVNKDQVQLDWEDLRGGQHGSRQDSGSRDLEKKVQALFHAFGYTI